MFYITSMNTLTTVTTKITSNVETDLEAFLLRIYPIGSIYTSVVNINPASLFGGVWESIGDRFLLGAGNSYSGGQTGGESSHTLTTAEMPSHNHSTNSVGAHTHTRGTMNITGTVPRAMACGNNATTVDAGTGAFSGTASVAANKLATSNSTNGWWNDNRTLSFDASKNWTGSTSSSGDHTHTITSTGSGTAHNNMPPYLVVYFWKRVG